MTDGHSPKSCMRCDTSPDLGGSTDVVHSYKGVVTENNVKLTPKAQQATQ